MTILTSTLERLSSAALALDRETIVGWNRAAERRFGIGADTVIGRRVAEVDALRGIPGLSEIGDVASATGQAVVVVIPEAPVGERETMLAMLAHELRNPLAPVLSALHVLRRHTAGDAVATHAREIAARHVKHLARLIEDLLDVWRVTRGAELEREAVDLADVVAQAAEMVQHLVRVAHGELAIDVPRAAFIVRGDPTRLVQVVGNLLNNAAKFTLPHGRISVTASAEHEWVVLRISDTGVGIAPDVLPHVFELFTQGRAAFDRARGGLGVGLALVRQIVEQHGGTVAAVSDGVGSGSTFVVRLPRHNGAVPERLAPQPTGVASRRRVLVVDDNGDARDMLQLVLEAEGFQVRTAADGGTGLAEAADFRPEAALVDLGLPGMDGYEVARRLRQMLGSTTFLAALTGYDDATTRRRVREASFDAHLVKPADPLEVVRLLSEATAA